MFTARYGLSLYIREILFVLKGLMHGVQNVMFIIIIINIKDWTSLIRSVSKVTTVLANVSSVFQLFSFLVVCSGMISAGYGFVAFFASVNASSVCIHLSCLVCL